MSYGFKEELSFGEMYERLFYEHIKDSEREVVWYGKDGDRLIQRSGVDLQIDDVFLDVKTQKQRHILSGNLPIETVSVMHEQKPGWFLDTEADAAVFIWEAWGALPASPSIHHRLWVLMINDDARRCVSELKDEDKVRGYTIHNRDYGGYEAWNWMIPIPAFAENTIKQFSLEEVTADGIYQFVKKNKD